ncbi:hypothetical protein [Flavobacterium anhuiense]|uniref:hypothetical protein n=1 Tax=Flavobacterium anhuiense TaxID=459526 RepID=UPI0034D96D76
MKKLITILLLISISNNLLSQSVIATVYSGPHLILTTDWSRFSTKSILVEKIDGTKRKIYNISGSRATNPSAMYVEGIDSDFEQGSLVKVYALKPKATEILSTPIQATVNSGAHLEKATDWSLYSGRTILVEEINGMNQNIYKTTTNWNYNPNAMAVPTLENDYPQGTAVNV